MSEMNYSNEQIKIIYTAAQELRNEYSVTVEWQESRQLCTDKNKELTETINDRLVPLAYSQDGRVPKMIFANYSMMINNELFIIDPVMKSLVKLDNDKGGVRSFLNTSQLRALYNCEDVCIIGIDRLCSVEVPKHYKLIYKDVKGLVIDFVESQGGKTTIMPEALKRANQFLLDDAKSDE